MLVFRDAERRSDTQTEFAGLDGLLRRLADAGDRELATEALIESGMLEAAIIDSINPDQDRFAGREAAWRELTLETAKLFRSSRRCAQADTRRHARAARRALAWAMRTCKAGPITLTTPGGYAWCALYPETYLEAAEQFLASSSPLPTVVIGLRGIGASLSAVVAAAVAAGGREVESLTLRPRGDPCDRQVRFDTRLSTHLRRRAEAGAWFLVVDEGPGLSGSSFAGTATALNAIGAGDEQIVLFPSVVPHASRLRSPEARSRWSRHRKLQVGFESRREVLAPGLTQARDLSGGLWRQVLAPDSGRPPVAPQHERRKYLSPDGAVVFRYAGLGRSGHARLARAEALANAGFTAEPKSFADGFLGTAFVPGQSLHRARRSPEAIANAVRYLGWLGRNAQTGEAVAGDELQPMIRRNVELSLGQSGSDRLSGLDAWRVRLAGVPRVAIDGRLSPHEWIRSRDGRLYKADALDHHDDHFLPGATDLAWDVAGLAIEWGLTEADGRDFAQAVASEAGDPALTQRLPYYETAYLAFRTGWAQLAAESMVESGDRSRLERYVLRYRAALDRALTRMA